jgi:ribosomal small subunit protein bTHX
MGRGDKKTRRGKIAIQSKGKYRKNKAYKNPETKKDDAPKKAE